MAKGKEIKQSNRMEGGLVSVAVLEAEREEREGGES